MRGGLTYGNTQFLNSLYTGMEPTPNQSTDPLWARAAHLLFYEISPLNLSLCERCRAGLQQMGPYSPWSMTLTFHCHGGQQQQQIYYLLLITHCLLVASSVFKSIKAADSSLAEINTNANTNIYTCAINKIVSILYLYYCNAVIAFGGAANTVKTATQQKMTAGMGMGFSFSTSMTSLEDPLVQLFLVAVMSVVHVVYKKRTAIFRIELSNAF